MLFTKPPNKEVQYLFVVALGRSGSTLVQNILNSFEGVHIFGENEFVLEAATSLATLDARVRSMQPPPGPEHPWFGVGDVDVEGLSVQLRKTIDGIFFQRGFKGRRQIVGFKEIRWHIEPWKVFEGMALLFPNAKYVFNFRDAKHISRSGWHTRNPFGEGELKAHQLVLRGIAEDLGASSICLEYEEYTSHPESLVRLADFLERQFDEDKVKAVLGRKLTHLK
jgi:hypothetical protein